MFKGHICTHVSADLAIMDKQADHVGLVARGRFQKVLELRYVSNVQPVAVAVARTLQQVTAARQESRHVVPAHRVRMERTRTSAVANHANYVLRTVSSAVLVTTLMVKQLP